MVENKFSLVDLGKFSEPISKLIDAVSHSIGVLYEPTRIRREAKAEADAALILAKADLKRIDLMQRAVRRLSVQEMKRQENIENIVKLAAENLPATVSKEPVDPDWVSRFFDDCKDVSDQELQILWARLLAGEVAAPTSCSRKTLSLLKNLSTKDSALFKKLCSLIWSKEGHYFFPYEKDFRIGSQLEKYDIVYGDCLHLESLGLINSRAGIALQISYGEQFDYASYKHICYFEPKNMKIDIFVLPLTESGIELFRVSNPELNWSFYVDSLRLFHDYYNAILVCPF